MSTGSRDRDRYRGRQQSCCVPRPTWRRNRCYTVRIYVRHVARALICPHLIYGCNMRAICCGFPAVDHVKLPGAVHCVLSGFGNISFGHVLRQETGRELDRREEVRGAGPRGPGILGRRSEKRALGDSTTRRGKLRWCHGRRCFLGTSTQERRLDTVLRCVPVDIGLLKSIQCPERTGPRRVRCDRPGPFSH